MGSDRAGPAKPVFTTASRPPGPRNCVLPTEKDRGGGMRFRCAVAQRCRPELGIPNRLRAFPPSAVRGSRPSGPQCRSEPNFAKT